VIWLLAAAWAADLSLQIQAVDTTVTQTTRSRLSQRLGRVQDFYAHGLGIPYPPSLVIDVTLYGDRDIYRQVAKKSGLPPWANGFFRAGPGIAPQAALWAQDDREAMIGVFLHEGSHFLFRYAGRTPRWLNEGLAQCFEHSRISGNVLTVHPPPYYLDFLRREGHIEVEAIVLDPTQWNDLPSGKVGPLYIRGWALTAFLLSSKGGQQTLAAILRSYKVEGTRQSGLDAIEATYRGGRAGLERDLQRWVANPPASVVVPRSVAVEEEVDGMWRTCPDGKLVSAKVGCD